MRTKIDYTKLNKLGTFRNQWRERICTLYEHPTDPLRVISVGVSIHNGKETVCDELRTEYPRQLLANDWSTRY
jgi:hypothetical protein